MHTPLVKKRIGASLSKRGGAQRTVQGWDCIEKMKWCRGHSKKTVGASVLLLLHLRSPAVVRPTVSLRCERDQVVGRRYEVIGM